MYNCMQLAIHIIMVNDKGVAIAKRLQNVTGFDKNCL